MTDILAVRWTGENLADIEQLLQNTTVTVEQNNDTLLLQDSGSHLFVSLDEFIIVEDDNVYVMPESQMLETYAVNWLD